MSLNDTQLELLSTLISHVGLTEVLLALATIAAHNHQQMEVMEDRDQSDKWEKISRKLEKLTYLAGSMDL